MSQPAAHALCSFVPVFMRFLREGLAEVPISPARFQLLEALKKEGDLSMVELADRLTVTKRNITSLVDGLEGEGLVGRMPHPTDRRSTLIQLTVSGDETFRRAAYIQQKHLSKLINKLGETQKEEMTRTLNYMTQLLVDD